MIRPRSANDAAAAALPVSREELDPLCQSPVLFDSLIDEREDACVFSKTLAMSDPGVAAQRVTPRWPHHLPGDLVIALTGQAAIIALRRKGIISDHWRGHGVRIHDARFSAPVYPGERFYTRVEIVRIRRLGEVMHARFRFDMWKDGASGERIQTYRSTQDAMLFPG
jgi:hypothetical protein